MLDSRILRAMNDLEEEMLLETAEIMGYMEAAEMNKYNIFFKKRILRIVLVAAAAAALLSVSAFALSNWYTETYILSEKPELGSMAEQALSDASRFGGSDPDEALLSPVVSYENGDQGQSGVYRFSSTSGVIGYYESGEISYVDARSSGAENPAGIQKYTDPYESFFADEAEMKAYVEKLEKAAPILMDTLQQDGWISGSSENIARIWVNDIYGKETIFNGTTAVVHVLMNDDTAYELWLHPETLECEGFMFWKAEDMPNTRNGLFSALKEGKEVQWQYSISNNPNALG